MSNVVGHCQTNPNLSPGEGRSRGQVSKVVEHCRTYPHLSPGGEGEVAVKCRTLPNIVQHFRNYLKGEGEEFGLSVEQC